jgi:hypothetical protein
MNAKAAIEYTPSGYPVRKSLIPFDAEFFNEGNDHNPVVARTCPECHGFGRHVHCNRE